MCDNFDHGLIKFAVAYNIVVISVHLSHDLGPKLIVTVVECNLVEAAMEHCA